MQLQLFKSLWGVVSIDGGHKSLAQALAPLAAQGYSGVECSVRLAYDLDRLELEAEEHGGGGGGFAALLQRHSLQWVPILFSSGPVDGWDPFLPGARHPRAGHGDSVARHAAALAGQAEAAHRLADGAVAIPFFNAHTGHDSFAPDKARALFAEVAALEGRLEGAGVVHEIHRGRATFSPWALQRLLPSLPEVKLVADYAHWTCVTETSAPAPEACPLLRRALQDVAPHIHHVHARVGYANGAQVPDPRAPEWRAHTEAFETWWDAVWAAQRTRGAAVSTLTPEHGPPPYQPTLPFTRQPVADLDEVNLWLGRRQAERFRRLHHVADAGATVGAAPA